MNKDIKIRQLFEIIAEPIPQKDKARQKTSRIKKGLMAVAAAGLLAYSALATYQWVHIGKENLQIQKSAEQEKCGLIKKYEDRLQAQDAEHEKEKKDMLVKYQEDKKKKDAERISNLEIEFNKKGFGQLNGSLEDEIKEIKKAQEGNKSGFWGGISGALEKSIPDLLETIEDYKKQIAEKDKAVQALQAELKSIRTEKDWASDKLEQRINEITRALEAANAVNANLKAKYTQLENILFVSLTAYRRSDNGVHYVFFKLHFQDGDNVTNIMDDKKYYISKNIAEKLDAAKILSSGKFDKPFDRLWIKAEYKDGVAQHFLFSEDSRQETIQSMPISKQDIMAFIQSVSSRYVK